MVTVRYFAAAAEAAGATSETLTAESVERSYSIRASGGASGSTQSSRRVPGWSTGPPAGADHWARAPQSTSCLPSPEAEPLNPGA